MFKTSTSYLTTNIGQLQMRHLQILLQNQHLTESPDTSSYIWGMVCSPLEKLIGILLAQELVTGSTTVLRQYLNQSCRSSCKQAAPPISHCLLFLLHRGFGHIRPLTACTFHNTTIQFFTLIKIKFRVSEAFFS